MRSSSTDLGGEDLHPDHLREAADLCVATLHPVAPLDWSICPEGMEWSCHFTLFHLNRALFSYATSLAARSDGPSPFRLGSLLDRHSGDEAPPPTLLSSLRALANVLADVAQSAPADARGFHLMGMADRTGFLGMGCDEILIHTDDIARAFGVQFRPPNALVRPVLLRLFPWAPSGREPWETLRWANGRAGLPDRDRLSADWIWHCAPLEDWDGTDPTRRAS